MSHEPPCDVCGGDCFNDHPPKADNCRCAWNPPRPPRSRFGWLGKLNTVLGWVGLVLVWTVDTDPATGKYVASVGYKLWRKRNFLKWINR